MVGLGPGAATTPPRLPRLRSGARSALRLAGLRSGTHGGARAGRGACKPPTTTTTRRGVSCGRPMVGRGAASSNHTFNNRLAGEDSFCRRSVVLPDSDPVPTVGLGPGAATTPPRLPRLRSGGRLRPSSCRTPIRHPRWGAGWARRAATDAFPFRNRSGTLKSPSMGCSRRSPASCGRSCLPRPSPELGPGYPGPTRRRS